MNTLYRILDRVLETSLFLTLAAMCAVVAINIFCRFLLQFSLSWADELAQVLLVWMTFLGAALAMRDKAHYTFSYLVRSLPGKLQWAVRLIGVLMTFGMTAGLIFWSVKVTILIREWVMPALGISRALVYGACPAGCFFLLLYVFRDFVRLCRMRPRGIHMSGDLPS